MVGVPFFRRVWGFDAPTAYYAAMPGGLQDMVVFGAEAGANPRTLSLIHATRVLLIVTLAPAFLTFAYGAELTNPIGAPAVELPLQELALMVAAALIGWKGGERLGLFGASILGPMIVTACLSLAGFIHYRPPAEAILAAQFFIGCGIGVHFLGITWGELTRVVLAGVAYVLLLAVLAAAFTAFVTMLGLGHPVEAFLAFAPGGQAEMTVLAIVTGADLGFVITHHLTRIVLVIVGAPVAAALIARRFLD
jgi:membrane AbrB-like protein